MPKSFVVAIGAAVMAASLAFASSTTRAERRQVCAPGMGLHCDSTTPDPGPSVTLRNQRIQAGMGAAQSIVGIMGLIVDLIDSGSPTESRESERGRVQSEMLDERRDARLLAARWYASGLRQLQAGDYVSAEAHFGAAHKYATDGLADEDLATRYLRAQRLAEAEIHLRNGLEMIGAKNYVAADRELSLAQNRAIYANANDVSARIGAYRKELQAKFPRKNFNTTPTCVEVNGRPMCD